MSNRIKHLQLVIGRSNKRLSARAWIDRVGKEMDKRKFPIYQFMLIPGKEKA